MRYTNLFHLFTLSACSLLQQTVGLGRSSEADCTACLLLKSRRSSH